MLSKDVDVFEHDVFAVGDQLGPVLGPRIAHGRVDQAEVAEAEAVGADVEDVALGPDAVVDVVLVILLALEQRLPRAAGIGGRRITHLGAGERARRGEEPGTAARAPHVDPEQLVGLLVEERVGGRLAQPVAPQAKRALGRVLADVEQDAGRGRPGDGGDLLDAIGLERSGHQILDEERVLAESGEIDRVGQTNAVVADHEDAEREKRMALGERVEIERDLLGRVEPVGLSAVDRVLLAFLRPRVIEMVAATVGDGRVVFLDAAQDLLVERFLECFHRLHHGRGIGVLGFEIRGHARIVFVAQPEIVVFAAVAVNDVDPGDSGGTGRDGHGGPMVP